MKKIYNYNEMMEVIEKEGGKVYIGYWGNDHNERLISKRCQELDGQALKMDCLKGLDYYKSVNGFQSAFIHNLKNKGIIFN